MSTKENDDNMLPKAPALKSSASYWFGKGSSSNKDIEVRETDGEDQLKALRLLDRRPHFIFVVDATGSMTNFTTSMSSTLKQVITVMNMLYSGEASVSVVVYYDYCEAKVIKEFHAHTPSDMAKLIRFVKNIRATGGGDWPEAAKTGFCTVLKYLMKPGAVTRDNKIVIHFTDAPPHDITNKFENFDAEKKALLKDQKECVSNGTYEDHPGFDWIKLCDEFSKLRIPVYVVISMILSLFHVSIMSLESQR